jgi:hypothetical protein
MELMMIVFMQAANNTVQFPAGISACALFISWFCYVRNVEVEKEIPNEATEEETGTVTCVRYTGCIITTVQRGTNLTNDMEYRSSFSVCIPYSYI